MNAQAGFLGSWAKVIPLCIRAKQLMLKGKKAWFCCFCHIIASLFCRRNKVTPMVMLFGICFPSRFYTSEWGILTSGVKTQGGYSWYPDVFTLNGSVIERQVQRCSGSTYYFQRLPWIEGFKHDQLPQLTSNSINLLHTHSRQRSLKTLCESRTLSRNICMWSYKFVCLVYFKPKIQNASKHRASKGSKTWHRRASKLAAEECG